MHAVGHWAAHCGRQYNKSMQFLASKVAGTVELHCCVCTMWPFSIAVSHGGRLVSHGRRPDQVCRSNTCMDATQMQSDQALMLGPFLGGLYT